MPPAATVTVDQRAENRMLAQGSESEQHVLPHSLERAAEHGPS